MSVTIEQCLDIAYSWNMDILSFRTTAGRERLRAALTALVAQARDEEADACAEVCEERHANGNYKYTHRSECYAAICARIAARKAIAQEGK